MFMLVYKSILHLSILFVFVVSMQNKETDQSCKPAVMEKTSPSLGAKAVNNNSSLHTKTKSNVEGFVKAPNTEVKRGPPPQPPVQKTQMPLVSL